MRRKAVKLRQFPLGGAKVNSTCIGSALLSYFVVGDSHNNIRLYTFENEEEIEVYSSNSNNTVQTEVTAVSLSTTEKEIFSGSNRGIINVWDMETAKLNSLLRGHSTSVNCFGIYPDDPSRLASGSYDTMIKLWDVRDKNNYATLKGHSKPVTAISISPDGCMLLSGSEDSTARVWDLRFGDKPLYVASDHNGPIVKVRFNPEDCMFATCSMDKTAKYFRCEDKCYGLASSTEMIATAVTAIGFSEDGKTLYTAANDVLKSWNMYKNGLLVETFDAGWKGVQDIAMVKGALMGIGCGGGAVSLWVCDVQKKIKNSSQVSEDSFVLPRIGKGARFNDDHQISELQNIVGMAIQRVNTIEERPTRDKDKDNSDKRAEEAERKREERRREEAERRKEEEEKRRQERLQKEARKQQQQQRKEAERRRMEEQRKRVQEQRRLQQQKLQERLYQERLSRQREMQQKVKKTMEENNLEMTLEQDMLDNSSMMNISTFVTDGQQKEKLRQIQLINDILKDSLKYENILSQRMGKLMPILSFWKQGNTKAALECLDAQAHAVKIDFASTILTTPRFKAGITPEVALFLANMLGELLANEKHSSYIVTLLRNLNVLVLMFKDELIKIKNFNPMTRVDISREERLAKYDKLIDGFLNVFKLERLKKYNDAFKKGEREERLEVAHELYKNLEEILIKIMPKSEPEPA